eukprot:scaffold45326_cov61-Phaeocystis_antarctica.AAC.2
MRSLDLAPLRPWTSPLGLKKEERAPREEGDYRYRTPQPHKIFRKARTGSGSRKAHVTVFLSQPSSVFGLRTFHGLVSESCKAAARIKALASATFGTAGWTGREAAQRSAWHAAGEHGEST